MDRGEVEEAFELLVREIDRVREALAEEVSAATRAGDYERAHALLEAAQRIEAFREKVEALRKEWPALLPKERRRPPGEKRPAGTRAGAGQRTPESAFRQPILEALTELGGRARVSEVLERVHEKMAGRLRSIDYEPLPSDPRTIRWYNTAQWCRNELVKEGLLAAGSPKGIWEITAAGREELRRLRARQGYYIAEE